MFAALQLAVMLPRVDSILARKAFFFMLFDFVAIIYWVSGCYSNETIPSK